VIEERLRHGDWTAIRRGAYVETHLLAALDGVARHSLLVRAVLGALAGRAVVYGYSALALQGVPLWGVDLSVVHVVRETHRSGRSEAGVVHHPIDLHAEDVVSVDGLLLTRPELSVVAAARLHTFEIGVALADGTRRLLAFDDDVADRILDRERAWAGTVTARQVIGFSDGLAESVGESRSRVMIARLGLPRPILQKSFHRTDGSVYARADFYFDEFRTVGEFDGRQKYGRELAEPGRASADLDGANVVWREKRREDMLRDQGLEVVRWTWADLDSHDGAVKARFLAAFERFRRRAG
jgi:hypothetical protein